MTRAATYARLSASRLGDEAPGLDRQQEAVRRAVEGRGWEVAEEIREADVSAWSGAARGRSPQAELAADEALLEKLAHDRYVRRSITDAEFRAARD